jgi:uridine kinase
VPREVLTQRGRSNKKIPRQWVFLLRRKGDKFIPPKPNYADYSIKAGSDIQIKHISKIAFYTAE